MRAPQAQAPARSVQCGCEKRRHGRRTLPGWHKSRRWRYGDHDALTRERGEFEWHGQADRAIADDRGKQRTRDRQRKPKLDPVMPLPERMPQAEPPAVDAREMRKPLQTAACEGAKAPRLPHARAPPNTQATARTVEYVRRRNAACSQRPNEAVEKVSSRRHSAVNQTGYQVS